MTRQIAILGPTASGKSDVAMAFAIERGDVEIVAVDAMQVYRDMDIGTAKPTAADQRAVPHHCIDLVEPGEVFTVAEFQRCARTALSDIAGRGHTAMLVAGTGMYLTAVIDNLTLPGEWPEIRLRLEAETNIDALFGQLTALDPSAAAKIEPGNQRRIVRALEVCLGSGRPFSSFGPGTSAYPPIDTVQIGLRWPRDLLTERIAQRVRQMMDQGLLAEVQGLLDRPGGLSRTARQALGYRELIAVLEGSCTIDAAVTEIILRTRQFAVRQERWFRRDPRVQWVDITADPVAEVLPIVRQHLS
ncbi:MAG: tRNA (adenosine(37)-N6)-dimethylallyltransferase MiaA [Actinobacteria bacterium]|nr:tRNA (adenosine(37)-N6)-dimethylallyltransferase MiaA [Actinomycetota bacterium]